MKICTPNGQARKMSEEINKQDIIKALEKHREELTSIIDGFKQLDETDDRSFNRVVVQEIIFTLFEFVDTFVSTEINIHNFMQRRG